DGLRQHPRAQANPHPRLGHRPLLLRPTLPGETARGEYPSRAGFSEGVPGEEGGCGVGRSCPSLKNRFTQPRCAIKGRLRNEVAHLTPELRRLWFEECSQIISQW